MFYPTKGLFCNDLPIQQLKNFMNHYLNINSNAKTHNDLFIMVLQVFVN